MNDEMIEVVYKHVQADDPVQVNINILMACLTTCWARLKLYREGLSQLYPKQVLNFDTDSIIFSQRPGDPMLPTSDYLGEFTSDLKARDHIVMFASAGPKNYGYWTKYGKVEREVCSFTLNACGQSQLNFDLLKANVIAGVTVAQDEPQVIPIYNPHKIKWNADTKTLETVEETKQYWVVFDKHVVDPDTFQSCPYGYTQAEFEDVDMENIDILVGL